MNQFGYEGQVGCAAVTFRGGAAPSRPDQTEDEAIRGLEQYLSSKAGLASYAVPRFLRVLVDVSEDKTLQEDVGGEYVSLILKKLKTNLRKEGMLHLENTLFKGR